jgi:hypothetical protein
MKMTYHIGASTPASLHYLIPLAETNEKFAMAVAHMQAHTFKALLRVQIESLTFFKHRCEQEVKLVDDLLTSEKYHNTFGVYGEFWQKAFAEYSNEARKFASIGSRIVSESAKQASREVDSTIEDLTARTIAP